MSSSSSRHKMSLVFQLILTLLWFVSLIRISRAQVGHFIRDQDLPDPVCEAALSDYSHAVSGYTLCMSLNARPVSVCSQCGSQYERVLLTFRNLEMLHQKNKTCKQILSGQDTIDVVLHIFNDLITNKKSIWNRGYCDNCFTNGSVSLGLRKEALTYKKLVDAALKCFNDTTAGLRQTKSPVCQQCEALFLQSKDYFWHEVVRMDVHPGYHFTCIDLKDKFNYTGFMWGHQFGCNAPLQMGYWWFLVVLPICLVVFLSYGLWPIITFFLLKWHKTVLRMVKLVPSNHFDEALAKDDDDLVVEFRSCAEALADPGEPPYCPEEWYCDVARQELHLEQEMYKLIDHWERSQEMDWNMMTAFLSKAKAVPGRSRRDYSHDLQWLVHRKRGFQEMARNENLYVGIASHTEQPVVVVDEEEQEQEDANVI